jgi:hypothetical protein
VLGVAADAALAPKGARARGGAASNGVVPDEDAMALEFEALVAAYPFGCDEGRDEAEKAFAKARRAGVPFELIMAGARQLAERAAAANTPQRYVPQLKNWLGGKRWNDKKAAKPKPAKPERSAPKVNGAAAPLRLEVGMVLYRESDNGKIKVVDLRGDEGEILWLSPPVGSTIPQGQRQWCERRGLERKTARWKPVVESARKNE